MGKFLENAWYVAAWSDEVKRTPLARILLDQPIVFYRKEDGAAVAMQDRCPHRFVPLSGGKIQGDEIMCPYHGLTFNEDGHCTHLRAQALSSEQFCLRSYPVLDRYGCIWIWMGEAALADPGLIPHFGFFDAPTHVIAGRGLTHIKANYTLELDNLLDLSHLDFVHPTTLSNGEITGGEYKVYQKGDTVHSDWWVPNSPAPHQFAALMPLHKDPQWDKARADNIVDFWLDMRWDAPGTFYLDVGVAPAGTNRSSPIDMVQAHFVTPETEATTHYFWVYTNTALGQSREFMDGFLAVAKKAFNEEDKPMLEVQQRAMAGTDFWAEEPMILAEDAGAIRARRVLDKLIRAENARQPETSAKRAQLQAK
jgi:phenylpropionate dioxygenase-like ring-hydroxylating dioxygenase large terminal subunit